MFGKRCFYCRQKILKGEEMFTKKVRIYGKVGTFKRDFCSKEHQGEFEHRTYILLKNRRACLPCALR